MDTKKIDLRTKVAFEDLAIVDDPEEAGHRRQQEVEDAKLRRIISADDARHGRNRENFRLLLMAGLVCAMIFVLYRVLVSPTASADDRRWASAALASVISGAMVYLIRVPGTK